MRNLFLALGFFIFCTSSFALSPVNKSLWSGVAIEGYDPVAYFTEGAAKEGKSEFSYDWNGATWRFSSDENRSLFQRNPEKYAPQYGGYCAYAVSQNSTASIEPEQWTIVDEKLYLNYNADIRTKWRAKKEEFIKNADENWPQLLKN